MKKLKIMLLSLALFAVVGGALAFKAKFSRDFCVTEVTGSAICSEQVCPNPLPDQTIVLTGQTFYCTAEIANCQEDSPCEDEESVHLDANGGGN
jgi:hypothetical protein